jgi:uncharacterized sulfatase
VIITGDHGEFFYEHELFGHQDIVLEEILRIPLIVIEIGKKNTFHIIKNTVQLIDLTPTILEYYGLKIPEDFQWKSFLPSLEKKLTRGQDIVIS